MTSSTPPPTEAMTKGVSEISSEKTSRRNDGYGVSLSVQYLGNKGQNVKYFSGMKMITSVLAFSVNNHISETRHIQNMHVSLPAVGQHIE